MIFLTFLLSTFIFIDISSRVSLGRLWDSFPESEHPTAGILGTALKATGICGIKEQVFLNEQLCILFY